MFPYENLLVYKKAFEANRTVYDFLKTNKQIPAYARSQFGRASLSIMLNIAEGSAKFSQRDRKNFFVTARGSAFECCSLLCFMYDEGEISTEIKTDLYKAYEEICKMLFGLIRNLEN